MEGACKLRNFIEKSRHHVSNVTGDPISGVAAIAARWNILCDIFVCTKLCVNNIERQLGQLATDSRQMEETYGVSLRTQLSVTPRDARNVKILEDKMAKWMSTIVGTVKQFHRFEFEG